MSDVAGKKSGKNKQENDDDTGQGSKTGQVEFHDFLTPGELRDELPPQEKKRLLAVHGDINIANVKKQKEKRDHYKALKEGKITLAEHRQGLAERGMNSGFKPHFLSTTVQFGSGVIDSQNNPVPAEQMADTNEENRNELENAYRLRYAPQNAPKFNPKLKPM